MSPCVNASSLPPLSIPQNPLPTQINMFLLLPHINTTPNTTHHNSKGNLAIKLQIITIGVSLDSTLKFDSHISKTIKSCNNSLFKIKQIKHLLNKHTLNIIITSLVLSKLDYCNSLFLNINKKQTKRVNKILNQSCRYI